MPLGGDIGVLDRELESGVDRLASNDAGGQIRSADDEELGYLTHGQNSRAAARAVSSCYSDLVTEWWWRLDEWQHRMFGRLPGRLAYVWHLIWSPFCSWVDRRLGGPG